MADDDLKKRIKALKQRVKAAERRAEAMGKKKIGRRTLSNLSSEDRVSAKQTKKTAETRKKAEIKMTPGKGRGAPKMKYTPDNIRKRKYQGA